jgi:hypothetical protein
VRSPDRRRSGERGLRLRSATYDPFPIFDDDGDRKDCLDFMAKELNRFSVQIPAKAVS